ncbi:MAG: histidine triad nucleotide-binding protein [Pelagibacterales bacterium]|nr:histidine triad nucleotide-binding protein [Pelagibacterales bacterium]PPR16660.1 MAG: putative HIT-like protein [Alphaproteobacteria bacterium MarineAlpha9_Bin3]
MHKKYNKNNIFFKIINGEIPCDKVLETKHSLAFKDINPRAKIHILLIPKNPYLNLNDFISSADKLEKLDIFNAISEVVSLYNLEESGYRLLTNVGKDGHQEVQHLHFHILGGQPLGSFIKKLEIN